MYSSFNDLKQAVNVKTDILTVSMANLRDLVGKERLGENVIQDISKKLRKLGLEHYPNPLPRYQEQFAHVYNKDSHIEKIVQAVLLPDEHHDEILRQAATAGENAEKLNIIRKLLEE